MIPGFRERYELGGLLGQGGMGSVYQALDRELGVEVAVKILRADLEKPAAALAAELSAAARLRHPQIIPLYEAGVHEGSPFLVMKYVPGGSLSRLALEPPPWGELSLYLQQLLSALAFVHARGMLHRDIKPENV